jgi:hypothetical protein
VEHVEVIKSLLKKIELIEPTELNKHGDTECEAWGVRPDSPYPENGPIFKLHTDTLKGPHEEVLRAASGPGAVS